MGSLPAQGIDSRFNQFVHTADKIDPRITAEQPAVFVDEICRCALGPGMRARVHLGDAVPASAGHRGNVIANGNEIPVRARCGQEVAYLAAGRSVQFLIRIQDQDPVRLHQVESGITRVSEVISPRNRNHGRAKLTGDVSGRVRRTGVGHHNLADDSGNALETQSQRLRLVLDDHRKTKRGHAFLIKR